MCDELVSTDLKPKPNKLFTGESYIEADLADYQAMVEIIDGADMVVHFVVTLTNIRLKIFCIPILWAVIMSGRPHTMLASAVLSMPALYTLWECIQKQLP